MLMLHLSWPRIMRTWSAMAGAILAVLAVAWPQDVPLGARPAAMGNAFVAVADDGNAAFWNPAGLSLLPGLEINSMYADLYATGIRHSMLGLASPVKNWGSFGLAWSRIGYDDFELTYGENQFALTAARQLPYSLSIGVNAKLLRTDVQYEDISYGSASGWGLDVGLLYRTRRGLSLGLALKDVGDTGVKYDTGHSATVIQQSLLWGAAYRPGERLLLAAALDDRFHWGGEFRLTPALALRAGLQDDLKTSEPLGWSLGLGIGLSAIQFDYAYENMPTLPGTHRFSLAFTLARQEPWIRVEGISLHDLFAAQYKRYADHPVGVVRLVNVSDQGVEVRAGIEFNGLTDGPIYGEQAAVLEPGGMTDLPLTVVFNSKIVNVTADGSLQATVYLRSSSDDDGREQTLELGRKTNLFGRNAIRWDDVRNIAAFIEPKDESVRFVTSRALKAAEIEASYVHRNLLLAMAVFDLLGDYGLVYAPDPQTPYSAMSRRHEIVDHVQYPAETLAEGRGDCDDFVVLYASCLENVGVPAAVIDVPGHLFLAVAIGEKDDEAVTVGFEPGSFLNHDGRWWVPVETTLFGSPFQRAWQEGIKTAERWSNELRIVEVEAAWQEYPSNEMDILLQKGALDMEETDLFTRDLEMIRLRTYEHIMKDVSSAAGFDSTDGAACNEIGVRLGQAGLLDEAIRWLRTSCQLDSTSSHSFSNLGVAYSQRSLHQEALKAFHQALLLSPEDADIHLNLAFLYYEMGDLDRARIEYEKAIALNPDVEGRFDFLEKKQGPQKEDKQTGPQRGTFIWK